MQELHAGISSIAYGQADKCAQVLQQHVHSNAPEYKFMTPWNKANAGSITRCKDSCVMPDPGSTIELQLRSLTMRKSHSGAVDEACPHVGNKQEQQS